MLRPLILAGALAGTAFALSPRPAAPALGPGAVLHAHEALFAYLDDGDAEGAAKLFTDVRLGLSRSASGEWGDPPGSVVYTPDGEFTRSAKGGTKGGYEPLEMLSERFRGGETKIRAAWSDCHSEERSFAVLEFDHTSADGRTTRYRSTSLVRHARDGFRFYHWHVSTAPARR